MTPKLVHINYLHKPLVLTSSTTFSQSPLVTAAAVSFAAASSAFFFFSGFCLSFLLNENERNDQRFFVFSFFGFLLLSAGASPDESIPVASVASDTLLSSSVVAVALASSVSVAGVPFSTMTTAAVLTSSVFSSIFGAASASPPPFSTTGVASFSVTLSFSFSASSLTTLISLSCEIK